jgi:hypothetical protein
MIAVIPDLVILKETRGWFLSHLHGQKIVGSLVGEGNEVLIAQKREETDDEGKKKQWESDSIEADPICLHGGDLAMAGERTEG